VNADTLRTLGLASKLTTKLVEIAIHGDLLILRGDFETLYELVKKQSGRKTTASFENAGKGICVDYLTSFDTAIKDLTKMAGQLVGKIADENHVSALLLMNDMAAVYCKARSLQGA
jgi:hypothetical protein